MSTKVFCHPPNVNRSPQSWVQKEEKFYSHKQFVNLRNTASSRNWKCAHPAKMRLLFIKFLPRSLIGPFLCKWKIQIWTVRSLQIALPWLVRIMCADWLLGSHSNLTWTLASSVRGIVAKMRQIHTDYRILWRKRDGMATFSRGEWLGAPQPLSQEERAPTLALTGFYWLNLHRNTGCIWKTPWETVNPLG